MSDLYILGQILLAVILGGILGLQREYWGKFAGPRTYALVTAGSALFTSLSISFFGSNMAMAAAVITGIGFLGAGTIIHHENRVEGLTTAAGLWMTSAVGMTISAERYTLAIYITALMLVVLMFDDRRFKSESTKKKREDNKL